jgi:phytoene synthase
MRGDARHCAGIVRQHARTFALASHFLPPGKRRAAYALYAFCRVADDIVDCAGDDVAGAAARLRAFERRLDLALAGQPDDAIFRELASVVATYGVPPRVLRELLAGVARDLVPSRYESWEALGRYCEGVASTVGEMCTHVFGVAGGAAVRERALRHARTLGVAMQLTNILRDVGEDARRGRCYLPDADLADAGLTRDAVLAAGRHGDDALARDPRWIALMRFEIARARALYAAAAPGIALLSPDARRCASACATGYAAILGAIERCGYDSFATRARVPAADRVGILWKAWRGLPDDDAAADRPCVSWEHVRSESLRVAEHHVA